MLVTMDRAGRVVIPKEARDRLSLGAEAELELTLLGDTLQLSPVRRAARTYSVHDGFAVLDPIEGITTTDADVQIWRDADQR